MRDGGGQGTGWWWIPALTSRNDPRRGTRPKTTHPSIHLPPRPRIQSARFPYWRALTLSFIRSHPYPESLSSPSLRALRHSLWVSFPHADRERNREWVIASCRLILFAQVFLADLLCWTGSVFCGIWLVPATSLFHLPWGCFTNMARISSAGRTGAPWGADRYYQEHRRLSWFSFAMPYQGRYREIVWSSVQTFNVLDLLWLGLGSRGKWFDNLVVA